MKVLVGLLVVLLALLQYRLWFGDGSVQEVWRLNKEVRAAKAELLSLRSRNQALEAEVTDLKSGLDAIEERARSDLGMIDEDETFYQFVREKQARAARGLTSTKQTVNSLNSNDSDTSESVNSVNDDQTRGLVDRSVLPLVEAN